MYFDFREMTFYFTYTPALILVKVQSSKIIQKAEAEENGN
jgi:hypothetical protein